MSLSSSIVVNVVNDTAVHEHDWSVHSTCNTTRQSILQQDMIESLVVNDTAVFE